MEESKTRRSFKRKNQIKKHSCRTKLQYFGSKIICTTGLTKQQGKTRQVLALQKQNIIPK